MTLIQWSRISVKKRLLMYQAPITLSTERCPLQMSHPVLLWFNSSRWHCQNKYCTSVDPLTSRHNHYLWIKCSHNGVLSLDTLLRLKPVSSVKAELGRLTARQPHLEKWDRLQLKQSAGVLTEVAVIWTMWFSVFESLCVYKGNPMLTRLDPEVMKTQSISDTHSS